jgi:signal peptidase I
MEWLLIRPFFREIIVMLALAAVIFLALNIITQASIIEKNSMQPTLDVGQRIIINKVVYNFHGPERGDIIIFHPPTNPNQKTPPFIKRIIGLPGDIVEVKDGTVYINDSPLEEPYIKAPPRYTLPVQKIPENNYFVLGDNRNNSNDSHNDWTVPRQSIIGKAWLSIFPLNKWGVISNYPLPTSQLYA